MKLLCFTLIWLIGLAQLGWSAPFVDEVPTFAGVCQQQGDWCTIRCQTVGGRDGICNKMQLCICRPL